MDYSTKLKDPRWQKRRLDILNRDEFTCQSCFDKTRTLHVHHIAYNGNPWEADDRHLITLCYECHMDEETRCKEEITEAIRQLKLNGFGSTAFSHVAMIFETDRGWHSYEPAFDILKMVVDDSELWSQMSDLFWERLREKNKDSKPDINPNDIL